MPALEKEDGYCNARVKNHPDGWPEDDDGEPKTGYCRHPAGFRTDHSGDGRCYLHGGVTADDKSVYSHPNNTYAEKHGFYSTRSNYYENRSYEEQCWIDSIVESILDDAQFDTDAKYKVQMVRNIAIDMHKLESANDYIDEVGLVHKDKTVGYTDDGKPIKVDEENVLNIAYDRLDKNVTRKLEKLGLMDDPESKKAESMGSIADEMSAMREQLSKENNGN